MYVAIAGNIKSVATINNVDFLRDLAVDKFQLNLMNSKNETNDKAVMRLIHYYLEINLVKKRIYALKNNDAKLFMYLHGLSGSSSAEFLQNTVISEENQHGTLTNIRITFLFYNIKGWFSELTEHFSYS